MTPSGGWPVMLVVVVLLCLIGCRDTVTGPTGPPLDLSPDVVGAYAGAFEGEVGLVGAPDSTVQDTFRLALEFRRLETETAFSYQGELLRGGMEPMPFYGCGSGPLVVSDDRTVQIDCVQGTQLGETVVFRLNAQFDPTFDVLRGRVSNVHGVDGAHYEIDLYRAADGG